MDGILPLWKPKGMTSHDCVFKLRKMLHTKKVGHTGTLDPEVEGVLPMCIGMATKVASYITESNKVYEAEVTLGFSTETEDGEGEVVERKKVSQPISLNEIQHVLQSFVGTITQIPPLYSAVRVNGMRLYEYARQGIPVERPERQVIIHQIELLSNQVKYEADTATFRLRIICSKGTYIRTLCVNIGEALGYPAHMSQLVRTASGSFEQEDAYTLEQIEQVVQEQKLVNILLPIDRGVRHLSRISISNEEENKIYNGAVLPIPNPVPETDPFCIVNEQQRLLAIYKIHPRKPAFMKPARVFHYD
ncbi:tRNA pseudouridine(55) synthase TruB [Pontibacillus litoralis]|uniref:tRNA pseudouridine synthase B n=1 Tax=Pontibacillus litoralis JSM 072002 TaxID=1385512 RepID=A0A0A5G5J9_9BACI|nr:tRNA pseudouridine(55) synthase TruB [Pontibacillus litoralis]KGX88401.1 tRNA pseudouridine synthase B [Pontibacillus litoralis JSM 072002]